MRIPLPAIVLSALVWTAAVLVGGQAVGFHRIVGGVVFAAFLGVGLGELRRRWERELARSGGDRLLTRWQAQGALGRFLITSGILVVPVVLLLLWWTIDLVSTPATTVTPDAAWMDEDLMGGFLAYLLPVDPAHPLAFALLVLGVGWEAVSPREPSRPELHRPPLSDRYLGLFPDRGHIGWHRPVVAVPPPPPFDALGALTGGRGAWPLARVSLDALVAREARVGFELHTDSPLQAGGSVAGRLVVRARTSLPPASSAQLVGVELATVEVRGAGDRRWVEVRGDELGKVPVTLAVPALAAGEVATLDLALPGPRLGPPSFHAGAAAVAWALEVRWDDGTTSALPVTVASSTALAHAVPSLVGGAEGSMPSVVRKGRRITIASPLPAKPGSEVEIRIESASASAERRMRVGLVADVTCHARAGAVDRRVVAVTTTSMTRAAEGFRLRLPADAPPSARTRGVTVRWSVVLCEEGTLGLVWLERPLLVV